VQIADNKSYFYNTNAVSMNPNPSDNASARREAIFREYEKVLSENGSKGPHLSKQYLYTEVADRLNYSAEYVGKVIVAHLKKH